MFKKLLLSLLLFTAVLNATAPTQENIAKLYVASFDRAPDTAGLNYWLGSGISLEEIAMSFFDQKETQEKYPSGTTTTVFIEAVYTNLFNREPDAEGLEYWVGSLDSGDISRSVFILVVINGAQGDDAVILQNKTEVGLYFATKGLDSAEDAIRVMADITEDLTTVSAAKKLIDELAPTPPPAPVANPCPDPINHNGTEYGCVESPYTGKIWLDRDLGAAQVCSSFDDTACYGDYYQWGRNFDGHQDSTSGITDTLAADVNNAGVEFIMTSSCPNDWALADGIGAERTANWSKTDGSSVCPAGFRVPTIDELKAELLDTGSAEIQNIDDAFASFLKLPSAGRRYSGGQMFDAGSRVIIWTSSVDGSGSLYLFWNSNAAFYERGSRVGGQSVRCLRN